MMRLWEISDYDQVSSWFKARSMPSPRRGDFPQVGFIVEGVAVGFLVQTDTPCAIIDFFISNPAASRRKRREALDSITDELVRAARSLGFRAVKADTEILTIKKRAQRSGFRALGEFSSFIKGL